MKFILAAFFVSLFALPSSAQQNVLLDFDSGTDGNINYTTSMRDSIQASISDVYEQFDISVFQSAPTTGPFSTLTFNSGGPGGVAEDIDFRNLNKSDNAVVNVDGLGFTSDSEVATISANIAAHEFGHLLGLRHRDSFGPIGSGVPDDLDSGFLPAYPGPTAATEFENHIMSTPAFGANPEVFAAAPAFLSERSAIKLAVSENGTIDNEIAMPNDSVADAQDIELAPLVVPNTIVTGQNAGEVFDVEAISVLGFISLGDVDVFAFEGEAGDLINLEVVSDATNRLASFDTELRLRDESGDLVDYFGEDAFNDDGIEPLDSVLIDIFLPTTGTFFAEVSAFSNSSSGEYELFINRFAIAAVPEPSSMVALTLLGFVACGRRRR